MRIAVVADTHDRYPPGLPARLGAADEIWHLGDVCEAALLAEFAQLGRPLRIVRGNCDGHAAWPRELHLDLGGMRFVLVHIPPTRVPPDTDVVVHGHTHVPRDETDLLGVRWLNPGCITRPRRGVPPSFGWLTIRPGRLDWQIEPL
jgi:hypothetical protein